MEFVNGLLLVIIVGVGGLILLALAFNAKM